MSEVKKTKKYKVIEVSEIVIEKVVNARDEDEAVEKFDEEVDKDWAVISKVAEWSASEITFIGRVSIGQTIDEKKEND